jgi:peptide/nickel transport system substrate-binding protein
MKKTPVLSFFLIMLLFLILAGCAPQEIEQKAGPDAKDTKAVETRTEERIAKAEPVVVRLEGGDWGYPTPFAHYSRGPGSALMRYIFDSLLERDEKGYIPWLAERWEIFDEGKRYVFHIRPGVKWQDGQPLTARDVAFSFNYYREHPPVWKDDLVLDKDYLLDISVLSDRQVEFVVSEARATFLEAAGRVSIIPEHIWTKVDKPDEFSGPEAVIGSGPLRLVDYSKEHGTYRYEAYGEFWGPRVRVDVLEFVPVSDPVLALEKGEIDLASIPADVLHRFKENPAYTVMENPGFWGYRLRFNMQKLPEFQNRDLRRAFAYTINREELVEKIARGEAIPGNPGILSPHHRWYNPQVPQYEHNSEKARELLAGLNANLKPAYELLVGGDREVRIGELLKEQLSQAGIELRVTSVDMKTRDARIAEGNYQLVLVGHGGWGQDPDYLRTRFVGAEGDWFSGTPGYANPEVDRLAQEQLKETNESRRKELIFRLQQLLAEDVPEIPLFLTTGHTVFRHESYDGWMHVFDHHAPTHNKLSYLERE